MFNNFEVPLLQHRSDDPKFAFTTLIYIYCTLAIQAKWRRGNISALIQLLCHVKYSVFHLALAAEVGDYDPADHPADYVSQFKMLPKQTQRQEEKIHDIQKGLT